MIRFSAHLGTLFGEAPLLERFDAASRAGFRAVELWSPFEYTVDEVAAAALAAGVQIVSFNLYAGDMGAGDRGRLNDPAQHESVVANAQEAVHLARAVGCSRVNALVGNLVDGQGKDEALTQATDTLREIALIFESDAITVLVEPLNRTQNPTYLIPSADDAIALISAVGRPNVGLLYDAYHAGMSGRVPNDEVLAHARSIRHVHVADWPGRHEPGTGELDLEGLVGALDSVGYTGHVGLEFLPRDGTLEALSWLPIEQRAADVRHRSTGIGARS